MREFQGTWRDLFQTFRIALDPRKMSLSLAGLAGSAIGIALILGVFAFAADARNPDLREQQTFGRAIANRNYAMAGLRMRAFADEHLGGGSCGARGGDRCWFSRKLCGKPAADPAGCAGRGCCPLRLLIPKDGIGAGLLVACGIWCWFLWASLGGAITRIAAIEAARDERIELSEAMDYAQRNFKSYFWAPVSVALGIAFFALCVVAVGWVLGGVAHLADNRFWSLGSPTLDRILHALSGLLLVAGFPLALLAGFLIVLLSIGLALGWPLMLPSVSAEGTDAFDAVSRSFSYLFGRPWRYLAYHLAAFLYAIPCILFVMGFACAMSCVALRLGACGMGDAFEPIHAYVKAALAILGIGAGAMPPPGLVDQAIGWILSAFLFVLYGLAAGYIPSFALSAWTTMYLLLRKDVDGMDIKEVYEEELEEPPAAPEAPKA